MKKAVYIIVVIVLLLIINGLTHSIIDLWQKQTLVTEAQKELDAQKLKNSKLKGELTLAQSQQFVDETARDKLFLSKPGESLVLIENDVNSMSDQSVKLKVLPNWQQWLNLFN